MIAIVAAVLAMAIKDCLGTFLVVAEARGRAWLAGLLDAGGDLATVVCTIVGAGTVISQGITWHSVEVLAAMMLTSLLGTTFWTKMSRHIKSHPGVPVEA